MNQPARPGSRARQSSRPRWWKALRTAVSACVVPLVPLIGLSTFTAGCSHPQIQKPMLSKWDSVPHDKNLAPFLRGSLHDLTLVDANTPIDVSAYSLVGQLRGTGSCLAPPGVLAYMTKEIEKHGFNNKLVPGYEHVTAGDVLADPNYAIVRVDALIPPGARKDDWIDMQVTALDGNPTRSLAHGVLFETDLKINGANPVDPVGAVNVFAKGKGPLLLNPAYALGDATNPTGPARASVRSGVVMAGAKVMNDRPIYLRLRDPQRSTARRIEARIWERFNDFSVAAAQDDGIVFLYVPPAYKGDWEHFVGVVEHLYLDSSADFNARKAKELVAEARKPNPYLYDITYGWEAIGKDALPFILPLLTDASPEISYAAARAAVFIGDNTGAAEQRLVQMAQTPGHPFRLSAVQTLSALPGSGSLDTAVAGLLDATEASVRIEAYKILARHHARDVETTVVGPADDLYNQKYALDIVRCDAPPIIYASRQGLPRIAVIGKIPEVRLPVMFTALNDRLTISSYGDQRYLTIYYRDPLRQGPVKVLSRTDVPELIARLGGSGPRDEDHLNFSYGEVLAVVQTLTQMGQLVAIDETGHQWNPSFMLQDLPRLRNVVREAPTITAGAEPATPLAPPGQPAVGAAHGPLFSGR